MYCFTWKGSHRNADFPAYTTNQRGEVLRDTRSKLMCKGSIMLYIKTANRETRFCIGVIIDKDLSVCHVCVSTWYPNQSSFFLFLFWVSCLIAVFSHYSSQTKLLRRRKFLIYQNKKKSCGVLLQNLDIFPGSVGHWGVKTAPILKEKENSTEVKGTGLSKGGKK